MKPGFLLRPDSGLMCFTPQSSPDEATEVPWSSNCPSASAQSLPGALSLLLVFCAGFSILLRSKSYSLSVKNRGMYPIV